MEIVFSVIGSTIAVISLQITIMNKAVELNSRITKLESATATLIYMQREQTDMLQRVATVEAIVSNSNRTIHQVQQYQKDEIDGTL